MGVRTETNVAGRKVRVTMATVFMAALSLWVDWEMERVAWFWDWATRLMACWAIERSVCSFDG